MVNFRRVVTVLAVLALFTGLGFAQQLGCSAQGTVSTTLRAEGLSEQSGDIIISCSQGIKIPPGGQIPLVNVTVFYSTAVTSRLLNKDGRSEALLLIDEPNSFQTSPGSNLGLIPCTTPLQGCAQVAGQDVMGTGNTLEYAVAVNPGTQTPAPNVYQGIVNGNSVTFYGVPVLPPTTVGSRTYRITNVRVNASQAAVNTAVQAFIQASDPAALPISNSQPIVGYTANGLKASIGSGVTGKQCVALTTSSTGTIKFTEQFGSAFKTRVKATANSLYSGQIVPADDSAHALGYVSGTPTAGLPATSQSLPGVTSNSESNFVTPTGVFTTAGFRPGLADFGTRLKATFNNIPSGVHVFVSLNNIGAPAADLAMPGALAGNANTADGSAYVGLAEPVTSETVGDGAAIGGAFPVVTGDDPSEVPIDSTSHSGTAVWEVVNTNPNTIESFSFAVSFSFTPATATNSPLPGASTVTLTYAPTPSGTAAGAASTSLTIPRFSNSSSATDTVLTIGVCRTILLYPYITNQAGFDTGVTVANTSMDPFTTGDNLTGAQNGSCTFTFYGGTTAAANTPPAAFKTPNIPAGTVWADTLSDPAVAPTFQGYAFAVCDFQFAHGFAFISDVGARNLAMGYLALVIPDLSPRTATAFGQGPAVGEQDAH